MKALIMFIIVTFSLGNLKSQIGNKYQESNIKDSLLLLNKNWTLKYVTNKRTNVLDTAKCKKNINMTVYNFLDDSLNIITNKSQIKMKSKLCIDDDGSMFFKLEYPNDRNQKVSKILNVMYVDENTLIINVSTCQKSLFWNCKWKYKSTWIFSNG